MEKHRQKKRISTLLTHVLADTRLFNISVNRIFRAGHFPALFGSDRQRHDTAAAGRRVCTAIAVPIARSYRIGLYRRIRLFFVETDISRNSGPEVNASG